MVDVSRRLFLGGALALAGAAVLAETEALASVPRIVGDGVHDDTAGLQALLNGAPVRIENDVVSVPAEGVILLQAGTYLITNPLLIGRDNVHLSGGRLIAGRDMHCMLEVRNAANCTLTGMYLDAAGHADTISVFS